MKIAEVNFERVVNLGNYQTARVGMRAILEGEEAPEEVLLELDRRVARMWADGVSGGLQPVFPPGELY